MYDSTLRKGPFLTLPELKKRWPGATEEEILIEQVAGRLFPLYEESRILDNNDEPALWVYPAIIPIDELGAIQWEKRTVLFIERNVEQVEQRQQHFLSKCLESEKEVNIEGHGFCSAVIRMRNEGKTEKEIAEYLSNKGLSRAIVGALLARDEEPITEEGYRRKVDRLQQKKTDV